MSYQDLKDGARGRRWMMPFLLIAGVSALAHLWCLGSVYFLDDVLQIRDNTHLREGAWWKSGVSPWTYFCYQLQTKLWGTSPVGFHFVNWLLHTGVAMALYVFGRDALTWKNARGIALGSALLFVAHPLASEIPNYARTQDIAWVTLFSILAAWFAVRMMHGFRWWLLGAVLLSVVGATFSKGPGLGHALMMVVFAVVACARREDWQALWKRWRVVLAVGVAGLLVLWFSGVLEMLYYRGAVHRESDRLFWHGVTLCRVFWKFVALFLFPKGLCADHFIAGTLSWEDPQALPAVVGLALWLLVATGLMIWPRTRFIGMCLWLFAGAIVLRFYFFINEFMPEYRIYPGLPWLCLGVMAALAAGWSRLTKVPPAGLVGGLLAVLCLVSAKRSFQWHDLDRLCAATLVEYPGQARALWMLQRRDVRLEEWDEVLKRHESFRAVEAAFLEENKRTHPGKAMSAGHQTMSQVALLGYRAEALAALGHEDRALAEFLMVEQGLLRRGIPRETESAIWGVYDHALGLVYEKRGELDKALEALERTDGMNHRGLDIERVKAKIAAEEE